MATQSSILTWRIPWTEEPGGLQTMGSQKELDTTERLTLSIYAYFTTILKRKDNTHSKLPGFTNTSSRQDCPPAPGYCLQSPCCVGLSRSVVSGSETPWTVAR